MMTKDRLAWPLERDVACGISEYDDNPFIRALPPPPSPKEQFNFLRSIPPCTDEERTLAPHLREQLAFVRVKEAFIPTGEQMRSANQIDLLLRCGYIARNPAEGFYQAQMTDLAEEREEDVLAEMDRRRRMTQGLAADSTVIIGPSGQGKTTLMRKALAAYPQVVPHNLPGVGTITQIVWIRVEAASDGSTKQTILSLFAAIDELLGSDYVERFGRLTREQLLVKARQICARHAMGLIVVDEIQNLSKSQAGESDLMKFLTSLVNVINVPILMIGTMKALEMMQSSFRTARRGEGVGSIIYEPAKEDGEWRTFLEALFELQWTQDRTALTDEIVTTLWDESQGIMDIAVKLFVLSQMRAIRTGRRKGRGELITPALVQTVARESLKLVRPMLDALRRKDMKALARYDDLTDLDVFLARQFSEDWKGAETPPDMNALAKSIGAKLDAPDGEVASGVLTAALAANGVDPSQMAEIMKMVANMRRSLDPIGASVSMLQQPRAKSRSPKKTVQPVTDSKDVGGTAGVDHVKAFADAGLLDDAA